MRQPGLDVFRLFNKVGLAVKKSTGGVQQPWVSTSPIDGDFYFAGAGTPPAPPPAQPAAVASLPIPQPPPAMRAPSWWQVRLEYQSYDGEAQNFGLAPVAAIRTSN